MKRLALCLILGIICAAMVSFAGAQEKTGKGQSSSKSLPPEACKAIERYIAKVDSASSIKDRGTRAAKYAEAQEELAAALKHREKDSLMSQAGEYARYSELVVSGDAKDANLDEWLDNKLKTRSWLLEMCSSYTTTR